MGKNNTHITCDNWRSISSRLLSTARNVSSSRFNRFKAAEHVEQFIADAFWRERMRCSIFLIWNETNKIVYTPNGRQQNLSTNTLENSIKYKDDSTGSNVFEKTIWRTKN